MIYVFIFGIIGFIILWIYALVKFKTCRAEFCLGSILGLVMYAYIVALNNSLEPTALDVYRGKTTLKITSVNGVPQDTVVVFKKYK